MEDGYLNVKPSKKIYSYGTNELCGEMKKASQLMLYSLFIVVNKEMLMPASEKSTEYRSVRC